MARYRMTFMYTSGVMGPTETYITPDLTGDPLGAAVDTFITLRTAMLPRSVEYQGIRASLVGSRRQSQLLTPGENIWRAPNLQIRVPAIGQYASEYGQIGIKPYGQTRGILQIAVSYNNGYTAIRYLGGLPNGMLSLEPNTVNIDTFPVWYQAYRSWSNNAVSSGWAIQGQAQPPAITAYTVANIIKDPTTNLIGITVNFTGAFPITQGQKLATQGFRPPKGVRAPTINGTWNVANVGAPTTATQTTVYLRGSEAISPAQVRFTPNSFIRQVLPTIYPIQGINYVRAGEHKRGRPTTAPRGRR